uniref:Uncharacterized protein n=1 Tax=Arundo donax TaxID=35708 RepID=A0A0A9AVR8_ARUDO
MATYYCMGSVKFFSLPLNIICYLFQGM